MPFVKIANQILSTDRIAAIDFEASINGQVGVEIEMFGSPDAFQFTGEFAGQAYDLLSNLQLTPGVSLGTDAPVTLADIEWIDLLASINGQAGVEIRVITDGPGITRQYTGDFAAQASQALLAATATA